MSEILPNLAENISAATAGANAVTVAFTVAAAYPDVRILEYSGIDTAAPLDGAVDTSGSSATWYSHDDKRPRLAQIPSPSRLQLQP